MDTSHHHEELEHLKGDGPLLVGTEEVMKVEYNIRVFQEYVSSSNIRGGETRTSVEGFISTENPNDLMDLVDAEKHYTLHLEDGRKIDFSLVDNRGTIDPTTGLY